MMNNRQTTGSIVKAAFIIQLTALVVLAVFRSDKLLSYTYDLPPNAVSEEMVFVAEKWNEQMKKTGAVWVSEKAVEFIDTLRGGDEY